MNKMKRSTAITLIIVLIAVLVGLAWFSYSVINDTVRGRNGDNLKLGLDLAGGVSVTYQVVGDEKPSKEDMDDTVRKISDRIENELGDEASTTEANVYAVGDDRISVEIPGVSDPNALLEQLGNPGTLYFIAQTDEDGNSNYTGSGEAATLNYEIEELLENGSVVVTGDQVRGAQAGYTTNSTTNAQEAVVDLTLNDDAAESFADATKKALEAGESIGIYYDGRFLSTPRVNSEITNGRATITGMADYDEANQLASYIRIGGLTLELEEIQSEVVGAQLGTNALNTSLLAAGIGILIVMIFMMVVYRIMGVSASLALAIYTGLIIGILQQFDITLTLPGIAGIILSIGMAVDANVIIFARVREEIASGKTVSAAIQMGFRKALSAIIDGNVTTLIAAVVLGLMGSGTVKGFAYTLGIGVVVSMFTALIITRLFMMSFYTLGVKSEKYYGKAPEIKIVDFVEKRKAFFGGSIAVILIGFIAMGVFAARGSNALNFSLEFLGGTSTTVTFDEEYSLEDAENEIVPKIIEATGVNGVQTQVVDNSNQIIFKTTSLELDKREALNEMLEEEYGVQPESIQSTNIGSTISSEMRRESIIAVLVAVALMLIYIFFRFKDIRFAFSAIIALIHDVLIVLTVYACVRLSVGSAFIACMLTVIGYSVNDTIVIFDRLRENMASLGRETSESLRTLANKSITQSLTRTASTSITTAVTVLMLIILGVTTIREFAIPLLIGVLCGTYSSICIATELWYIMRKSRKEVAGK